MRVRYVLIAGILAAAGVPLAWYGLNHRDLTVTFGGVIMWNLGVGTIAAIVVTRRRRR